MMVIKPLSVHILFLFLYVANGLYEDQVGKFDWRQSYVGEIKFSTIDTDATTKRVYVATKSNVVASMTIDTGDIVWRQILEKGPDGNIQLLHPTKSKIITVSGTNIIKVRGWDVKDGHLNLEWSIEAENVLYWFVFNGLLHKVYTSDNIISVDTYYLETGTKGKSTYTYPVHWFTGYDRCALSTGSLACLSVSGELSIVTLTKATKDQLIVNEHSENIKAIPGSPIPAFIIKNNNIKKIVFIKDNKAYTQTLSRGASPFIYTYMADRHILLQVSSPAQNTIVTEGAILEDSTLIESLSSKESINLLKIVNPSISSAFCGRSKANTVNCVLLITTDDQTLMLLKLPGSIKWHREESLTNIVSVEMVDLPVSDIEAAIEKEFGNKDSSPFSMFVRRLHSQSQQIYNILTTVLGLVDSPSKTVGNKNNLVRDQFGLHKIIVAVTSAGKVFGIDNLNGEILWSVLLNDIGEFYVNTLGDAPIVPMYLQRNSKHLSYPPMCTLLLKNKKSGNTVIFTFNPINGESQNKVKELPYRVVQAVPLSVLNTESIRCLILFDSTNIAHLYPDNNPLSSKPSPVYIYTANPINGVLQGFNVNVPISGKSLTSNEVWKIQFSKPTQVIAIGSKEAIEHVHSQGRVMSDRSVLYKYINPNMVAILTLAPDTTHKSVLTLHLLDTVSGIIVYSVVHKRATYPIHLVHSENWLLCSYYNDKNRRTEIASYELYDGNQMSNSTEFSSVGGSLIPPIVEKQAYIFPGFLQAMKPTITEKGITSKHILMATTSGHLLEMPWAFLDPRRPLGEPKEEGAIPYIPELPTPTESMINYNKTLMRVNGIYTAPSSLESTCLVFVHGLDLFYTRVAPSKTFDVLKEDFDYLVIIIVTTVLLISAYVTKNLASQKALKQAWK
ncbi:ER membrane protein complex subunit 1 isoform X2 [Daktulosphaira vitifoliae]|uniref:ER membrane protein complex subunit 1 isoform X2 n=1 Tax=Daktulosphaira vitifoliae TaxID=58002 RepID=UPI0021AAF788|nr:ER membrane protein complex subunit 1 isoform X2 [Daktulosphaira vitifoliae]